MFSKIYDTNHLIKSLFHVFFILNTIAKRMSIDCQMDGNKCSLVKFISQEKYLSQRIVIEMTSQMNGQVYLELGTQI